MILLTKMDRYLRNTEKAKIERRPEKVKDGISWKKPLTCT